MNALILLAFLALLLFAGKKLFDIRDWGKHPANTRQAPGKQPQYKGNRPGGIDMSSSIKICERIIEKLRRTDGSNKN